MNMEVEEVSSAEAVGTGVFDSSPSSAPTIEELLDSNEGLLEVGRAGAGSAANALSEVLMEEITIDVSEAHIIPSERVHEMYVETDHEVIVSLMEMGGKEGCDILLSFEEKEAKEIAAVMAWADSPDELDAETRNGALAELGNIVIGCFISSLADSAGVGLLPTPPELIEDNLETILTRFMVKRTQDVDFSVLFKTSFKRGEQTVNGALIAFVSDELIKILSAR